MLKLLWLLCPVAALATPLRIATGELPPYATQSRPDEGVALSIVRRAFELEGFTVQYTFMPWSRVQQETAQGKWDATAYWGATEARKQQFLLSDNVLTEQWVIVHRRQTPLDWQQLEDLKPYRLAVIADYTYTPQFHDLLQRGTLTGDPTPNDLLALRKLLAKRVDAIPIERNVACDLLNRYFTAEKARELVAHPRLLSEHFTTHLMLPKIRAESPARLAAFNRGLARLKQRGEYQRLLQRVSCPGGWY